MMLLLRFESAPLQQCHTCWLQQTPQVVYPPCPLGLFNVLFRACLRLAVEPFLTLFIRLCFRLGFEFFFGPFVRL